MGVEVVERGRAGVVAWWLGATPPAEPGAEAQEAAAPTMTGVIREAWS